jgi:sec-independent protein translocase protein TatA
VDFLAAVHLSASNIAFLEGLGGPELMMVLFVVLLLFGADKLPELARGLGKSMREIKKATSGVEDEIRKAMDDRTPPPEPPKKFPTHPPKTEATGATPGENSPAQPGN